VLPVVLLLALPATRPASLYHLKSEFCLIGVNTERSIVTQAAQRRPTDDMAALASVLYSAPGPESVGAAAEAKEAETQLQGVLELIKLHQDQPFLYAHALRLMTSSRVKIQRPESALLQRKQPPPESPLTDRQRSDISAFDRLAAKGESLDPANSYFPAMRMIGLLAAHRDSEAVAALHRAANAPRWRPYISDALLAMQRLQEIDAGERPSIVLIEAFSTPYPHLAQLREAIRIVTYFAVEKERMAGAVAGFQFRHDSMLLGAKMRFQDPNSIGNLVGVALVAVAGTRPAGAAPGPDEAQLSADERRQRQVDRYAAYLTSIGLTKEETWFREEAAAGWEVKKIVDRGSKLSPINTIGPGTIIISGVCLFLVSNVLCGLACGLLLQVPTARQIGFKIGVLATLALWQWVVLTIWGSNLFAWFNIAEEKEAIPVPGPLAFMSFVPLCFLSVIVPMGIAAIWERRHPRSDRYGPSIAATPCLIGAAVFSLLYVTVTSVLVSQETVLREAIHQSSANEGRYFAKLARIPWPAEAER